MLLVAVASEPLVAFAYRCGKEEVIFTSIVQTWEGAEPETRSLEPRVTCGFAEGIHH